MPLDNPFVHSSLGGSWDAVFNGEDYSAALGKVRTEIWALGLRNPFRFHIDSNDGVTEVWIGDVGQDDREEVSRLLKGDNGGWSWWEGDVVAPGTVAPVRPAVHTPPVHVYPHSNGNNSVTGGVLYRGGAYAAPLDGMYVFGDYGSGRLWKLDPATNGVSDLGVGTLGGIVDFHIDPHSGEILLAQYQMGKRIHRLKEAPLTGDPFPQTLGETGIFADLGTLTPNPGVVPYVPNLRFWSDEADKSRWFVMGGAADRMAYSRDGEWGFPEGMVTVKHFDMDMDRDRPGTVVKRLETRVLVRNATGVYGVSYRWNEAQTDAALVDVNGADFDLQPSGQGQPVKRSWRIPSRGECQTCHNPTAGFNLSLNTRQLNRDGELNATGGNFLSLLSQAGYLDGFGEDPNLLERFHPPGDPSVDVQQRVRSWLAVNCAYCHHPGSGVVESWDARGHLSIGEMRVLYGEPQSESFHSPGDVLIQPGSPESSIIWNRIQARDAVGSGSLNGYSQMPYLATHMVDTEGVAVLTEWINGHANMEPEHAGITAADAPEGSVVGTSVGLANASDPDVRTGGADQAMLSYAITGGNLGGLFGIDPATGEITVTGWLDPARHVLEITAWDHFVPNPKSSVTEVTIDVTADADANGNGLPDAWESHFGMSGATRSGDGDKDGVPEFFEMLGGGDPGDPASPGGPVFALVPANDLAATQYTWRQVNGMRAGTHFRVQGSAGMTGWRVLSEGVDYEVVSRVADGSGYERLTVRLIAAPAGGYFVRLASP